MKQKTTEEYHELWEAQRKVEIEFEWDKWTKEIPAIPMRAGWRMTPIPPATGAVARFHITDETGKAWVSVYLDCYARLGAMYSPNAEPLPYWEVYPVGGDIYRVLMPNIEELASAIQLSIDEQLQPDLASDKNNY